LGGKRKREKMGKARVRGILGQVGTGQRRGGNGEKGRVKRKGKKTGHWGVAGQVGFQ